MFKVVALASKSVVKHDELTTMSWDDLPVESLFKKSVQKAINANFPFVHDNFAQLKGLKIIQVPKLNLATMRRFLDRGYEVTFLSLKPSLNKAKVEELVRSYLKEFGISDSDKEGLIKLFIDLVFVECGVNFNSSNQGVRLKLKSNLNIEGEHRDFFIKIISRLQEYGQQGLGIDIANEEHYVLYKEGVASDGPFKFTQIFRYGVQKEEYQTEYFTMHTHPKYSQEVLIKAYSTDPERYRSMTFRKFLSHGDENILEQIVEGGRARATGVLSDSGLHFSLLMPKKNEPVIADGFGAVGAFRPNKDIRDKESYYSYLQMMKDFYQEGDYDKWRAYVLAENLGSEVFNIHKAINPEVSEDILSYFFHLLAHLLIAELEPEHFFSQDEVVAELLDLINKTNLLTEQYKGKVIALITNKEIIKLKEIVGIKPNSQNETSLTVLDDNTAINAFIEGDAKANSSISAHSNYTYGNGTLTVKGKMTEPELNALKDIFTSDDDKSALDGLMKRSQIVEPREQFFLQKNIIGHFVSNEEIDSLDVQTQGEFSSLSMEEMAEFVFFTGSHFRGFIEQKYGFFILKVGENISNDDFRMLHIMEEKLSQSTSLNQARSIAKEITEFCERINATNVDSQSIPTYSQPPSSSKAEAIDIATETSKTKVAKPKGLVQRFFSRVKASFYLEAKSL